MNHPRLSLAVLVIAMVCAGPSLADLARASDEPEAVALTFVSHQPAMRFPKSFWTFDVKLANRSPDTRWFLIPDPPEKELELAREAHAIDVVALGSEPGGGARVELLRISATHGLLALRLAPASEVVLRNLKLTSWDERPLESFEIWAARELRLDGRPLGGGELGLPEVLSTGSAEADASLEREIGGWADPELASHPLAYQADERWRLAVASNPTPKR